MRPILVTIPTAIIVSFLTLYGAYNYMPLSLIDQSGDMLGSTITTIASTDTIKDSRAVINTNFTNLNSDKLENTAYYSTTTHGTITSIPNLATVGTITSGTWNGTTLTVAKGGTGSTTLLTNGVLVGNGTSAITTVATGTSGQFLALVEGVPRWKTNALDETAAYNWSGNQTWSASTTFTNTVQMTGLVLDSQSVDALVAGGTSTLHSHSMMGGVFGTSTNSGTSTIAHGLGVIPKMIKVTGYCKNDGHKPLAFTGVAFNAVAAYSIAMYDDGTQTQVAYNQSFIYCNSDSATYDITGTIYSLDATNIKLNLTMGANAELVILWEAYK